MSRALLARLVLGAAVATCAVCAVLTLVTLQGATALGPPTPRPGAAAALAAAPEGERVVVVDVVDAVTFDARLPDEGGVVRVRALGVQPPGECYGTQATSFAARVLEGQAVSLIRPPGPATDRFDRQLATVLVRSRDYAVLAAEAGTVRAYPTAAAADRMPPVRDAQDRARAVERGVWGAPCLGAESVPAVEAVADDETPG